MKKVFLLIVVPALLVALGFAQTPAASSNIDQTSIKGCLGGTDGNYTVVEDNTGRILKITTTSVGLNPHVGHQVTLTGNATADKGFAVTGLNMVSEHCAAAAAVPATTVSPSPETASTPAPPAAPISTPADLSLIPAVAVGAPSATVGTPAETAAVPAATAATPAPTFNTPADSSVIPAVGAITSDTIVSATPEPVSTPATAATSPARLTPRSPTQPAATTAAAASAVATTPADPVNTPAAADAVPNASVSAASGPSITPPIANKPANVVWGRSVWLLGAFVILVLVIGALAPLGSRWRKRRVLDKMGPQNLSFSNEVFLDQSKSEEPAVRKIA